MESARKATNTTMYDHLAIHRFHPPRVAHAAARLI